VILHSKVSHASREAGFSLVEMLAVIAITVILLTAGISLLAGTGVQSRKTSSDLLAGLIEQARTLAITSRSCVVLAVAEPGDLPGDDERCRVGLFKIPEWPEGVSSPTALTGVQVSRWQILETGIVLLAGSVGGVMNPIDQPEVTLTYGGAKNLSAKVHFIAFNTRGRLCCPVDPTAVVQPAIAMRIAEGGYRGSPRKAVANLRGSQRTIAENRLQVGRVVARPYRIDG
jgi:prepilin-type N-terminal cleavage/methylation domain-containing protein